MVVELDDQTEREGYSRPRRENAGAGVERMQMGFDRKSYGTKRTKRQYNFLTNGRFLRKTKSNKKNLQKQRQQRKKEKEKVKEAEEGRLHKEAC